jgi:hypothetical protein
MRGNVNRQAAPIPQAELRVILLYAMLSVLGLAAILTGRPNWRELGWVTLGLGAGGMVRRISREWRRRREAEAAEQAAGERRALQAARRERDRQETARRQAERASRAEAAKRQAEARAAQRNTERLREQEEAARRAKQEQALAAEAQRLRSLSAAQLLAEVSAAFSRRGFRPESPGPDAACDLRLRPMDGGGIEVARCVPAGQSAGVADVKALESWRQEIGARHAYLIALSGFSPAAVRQVRGLPLTLVEAHLLAHWQQNC